MIAFSTDIPCERRYRLGGRCDSQRQGCRNDRRGPRDGAGHGAGRMGVPLQGYFDSLGGEAAAEAEKARIVARIPLGRIPRDADCAKVVYFLLSDYSSEMSGAALDVNGGEWVSP
jgi:hypothetical protein